jgi:energy-coupling factor transporter ATP-binding protein EcfA2
VPIPSHEAQTMLQEAIFRNMVNQKSSEKNNPFGMTTIVQQLDARDITSTIESLHDNREKMFHSAFIITIWAEDASAMRKAKSHVKVVMNSHRVYGSYPSRKQLETFIAAQPYPTYESFTFVEMVSSLAGLLCPTRNPNSSLANSERGLYFGDDRKTGKEIVIDLDALAAKMICLVGNSGSGKTFTILVLLGRLYASKRKVVYLTVKPDEGTRYKDMADYFAPDSCIINIGPGGRNINPLQVMHTGEGLTSLEASAIFDSHKVLVINFFKIWFEGALSPNMESYLNKSLNKVYQRAEIFRDQPSTWRKPFPVMTDLIAVWESDRDSKDDGESALALIRKTYYFDDALSYMNRQTDIDLSKGFTVIDLVNVPEIIKNAMNVLVTGMLATFFKTDYTKGVTIAVDEGGAFLREKELAKMVLTILTQGRSFDIGMIFATQQFADLEKAKLSEEFMTNTPIKMVLGYNLDKKAISYIQDFLMLDDTAVKDLKTSAKGQGIIKIGDTHAPIAVIPTIEEENIIKGVYTGNVQVNPTENHRQETQGKIKDQYVELAKKHKIVFTDWIEGEDYAINLKRMGYEFCKPQSIIGKGFANCWILKDIIKENDHIKNQTIDHYSSVIQLEGILIDYGFEDLDVQHFGDVDLSGTYRGVKFGFEYEHPESHNLSDIIEKKERGLRKYDELLFIGSKANVEVLIDGAGQDFAIKRGKDLEKWLKDKTTFYDSTSQRLNESMINEELMNEVI